MAVCLSPKKHCLICTYKLSSVSVLLQEHIIFHIWGVGMFDTWRSHNDLDHQLSVNWVDFCVIVPSWMMHNIFYYRNCITDFLYLHKYYVNLEFHVKNFSLLMSSFNTAANGLFQQVFNVKSPGPLSVVQLLYIIFIHDVNVMGSVKCIFVNTKHQLCHEH